MSSVRALVSDFGGVLTSPLWEAFSAVQAQEGLPLEALGKALARIAERDGENPLFALERGEMTEPDFLAGLEGALHEELGRSVSLRRFAESYFAALRPNEELFAYYRKLSERGLRLALLTNNVREWEPRWRSMLPFDDIFELVVDSGFVGLRKPDPAIYALTLDRLGLTGPETVFVDDVEVNVEAARAAGMRAVHFQTTGQARQDIESALVLDGLPVGKAG